MGNIFSEFFEGLPEVVKQDWQKFIHNPYFVPVSATIFVIVCLVLYILFFRKVHHIVRKDPNMLK